MRDNKQTTGETLKLPDRIAKDTARIRTKRLAAAAIGVTLLIVGVVAALLFILSSVG